MQTLIHSRLMPKLRGRSELKEAIEQVLSELQTEKQIVCPECKKAFVYEESEDKPRRIAILENLAKKAIDPRDKLAVAAADFLFKYRYDQKEIEPFEILKLLVENADMPEQWKQALIMGISDDTPLEIEKPVQIVEWQEDLILKEDDFPVQLQNGAGVVTLRDRDEFEVFKKGIKWR